MVKLEGDYGKSGEVAEHLAEMSNSPEAIRRHLRASRTLADTAVNILSLGGVTRREKRDTTRLIAQAQRNEAEQKRIRDAQYQREHDIEAERSWREYEERDRRAQESAKEYRAQKAREEARARGDDIDPIYDSDGHYHF